MADLDPAKEQAWDNLFEFLAGRRLPDPFREAWHERRLAAAFDAFPDYPEAE